MNRAAADRRARQQWPVDQELANEVHGNFRLRADTLATLQRRELQRVGATLSEGLAKPYVEAPISDAIEGRLARRLNLESGRFALVERAHDFMLVPWRPALEQRLGQQAGRIPRADGTSWRFGRGRGGPEI